MMTKHHDQASKLERASARVERLKAKATERTARAQQRSTHYAEVSRILADMAKLPHDTADLVVGTLVPLLQALQLEVERSASDESDRLNHISSTLQGLVSDHAGHLALLQQMQAALAHAVADDVDGAATAAHLESLQQVFREFATEQTAIKVMMAALAAQQAGSTAAGAVSYAPAVQTTPGSTSLAPLNYDASKGVVSVTVVAPSEGSVSGAPLPIVSSSASARFLVDLGVGPNNTYSGFNVSALFDNDNATVWGSIAQTALIDIPFESAVSVAGIRLRARPVYGNSGPRAITVRAYDGAGALLGSTDFRTSTWSDSVTRDFDLAALAAKGAVVRRLEVQLAEGEPSYAAPIGLSMMEILGADPAKLQSLATAQQRAMLPVTMPVTLGASGPCYVNTTQQVQLVSWPVVQVA